MKSLYASASIVLLVSSEALFAAPTQLDVKSHGLPAPGTRVVADDLELPEGFGDLAFQDAGITATYEADGRRISIETRRGPHTPRALRSGDPGTPLFEIDVRLVDERGVPFFVQFGGHGPMDDSWSTAHENTAIAFLSESTEKEIQSRVGTAVRALRSLGEVRFNRALTPEHQALMSVLPLVQSMLVVENSETISEPLAVPASTCSLKNKISIYQSPYGAFGAYHSATLAQVISKTGTPVTAWIACNHGKCPGASGMSLKCSWTSLANRCAIAGWPPTCKSNYGVLCGEHVCNDDTLMEYSSVRYGTSPSIWTCVDCSVRRVPPSCF